MSNFISIILLVASLGLFFFYINPNYAGTINASTFAEKSIKELKVDEEQYATALTKTREISEIQTGLLTQFNNIPRSNRDRLSKLLPDHVDTVHLILDITRIVRRHNMALKNIAITSVGNSTQVGDQAFGPQNSTFDSVELTFSVAGSYDTFLKFIRDLESSLRLIDITALSFVSGKDKEDGEYTFNFNIKTYFLK